MSAEIWIVFPTDYAERIEAHISVKAIRLCNVKSISLEAMDRANGDDFWQIEVDGETEAWSGRMHEICSADQLPRALEVVMDRVRDKIDWNKFSSVE